MNVLIKIYKKNKAVNLTTFIYILNDKLEKQL